MAHIYAIRQMNLAAQLEALRLKGFTEEHAGIIVLVREAAIVLFDAFPDALLLVGGANLILFQESDRHSSDLDLTPVGDLPSFDALRDVLVTGLEPLAKLLDLNPLDITVSIKGLTVSGRQKQLFTIDIGNLGSVLRTNQDTNRLEATGTDRVANVRSASRDQLLLLKAEAFLFRPKVKSRDAYDIMKLLGRGAEFSGNLKQHLEDQMIGEFDAEHIRERIESVDPKRCRSELESFIPESTYRELEALGFQPLRDALERIFEDWL
jgi:hypothetical protein